MANQIVVSAGAKVRNLSGVLTATSGVVSFLPIDVSLGIPQLDVNGKILVSQLPNSVMEYKGTWDASTNTPTLANGTGNQGDVYLCNVAGTVNFGAGAIAFVVGDQVIYSGSIWQRASGATGTVTSVAVTETGDSLNITGSPITTSGTINIGFNGTNLQYVNGAGNLTTFPILTGYVTAVSGTAPVVSSGGTTPAISMAAATASVDGYLSATDFAIFSAKQSALTFSSPLVNTSGTISIPAATTSVNGYLPSADFTTFNNKQNAITLTTTGTSGASTLVGATLNIPNYSSALTGYVPYTGATQDVDLGAFKLNAQSLHIKGTGGLGHLGLKHQSASATASANEVSLFADSLGDFSWLNGNLYLSKFITSGNTAARSYTFPDATCNIPNDSLVVHLAGTETITGAKTFSGGATFTSSLTTTSNVTFSNSGFTLVLQPPTLSVNRTVTLPNGTGTLALTSDISYPVTSVFGRTGAVVAVSADYNTSQVTEVTNLYFTDSRARLALSFAAGSGAYNSTTGVITIPTNNNQITNGAGYTTNVGTVTSVAATGGTGISITGSPITTSGTITITNTAPDQVVALTASTGISVTGTYPNFTITNTSPSSGGTVTSVAALTIGTTGTDLSSTVANSTTTPVITLNVPTASATNRGVLASADWTTFNNKQNALTNPVTGTGTTNYLPKFTGTSTIGDSTMQDDGTNVSITGGFTANSFLRVFKNGSDSLGSGPFMALYNAGATAAIFQQLNASNGLDWWTTFGKLMTLTASGNLGLGVTPSAWSNSGNLDLDVYLSLSSQGTYGGTINNNAYYNAGWKYKGANYATQYQTLAGEHRFLTAGVGSGAGAAITFTQAMTLFSDGNLLLTNGTVSNAGYKLDVNGTGRFSDELYLIKSSTGGSTGQYPEIFVQNSNTNVTGGNVSVAATRWITLNGGAGNVSGQAAAISTASDNYLRFGTLSNHRIDFITNGNTALSLASTGAATFTNTVNINNNTGGAGLSMTNTAAPNITGIGSPTRGMILNGLSTTAAATGAAFYFYGATSSYTSLTSGDLLQVTNNDAVKFRLDYAGAATFSSSITTGATSYGAGAIKLGIRNAGTATGAGGYMAIEIDGSTYFLNLFTTTP